MDETTYVMNALSERSGDTQSHKMRLLHIFKLKLYQGLKSCIRRII